MIEHIGEEGTEQFTVTTSVDGKVIREQPIHDPFLHNKTVVGISRWDLFKAMFHKQYTVTVQVSVHGTEGVQRAIMTMNPRELQRSTEEILEARRLSRERHARGEYGPCSGIAAQA
jgi:hypothetical protein